MHAAKQSIETKRTFFFTNHLISFDLDLKRKIKRLMEIPIQADLDCEAKISNVPVKVTSKRPRRFLMLNVQNKWP